MAQNNENTQNEAFAPESELAADKQEPATKNIKKKKGRIRRFFSGLSNTEISIIIIGILLAAIMIGAFYYLYTEALKTRRALPQNGLISADDEQSWMLKVVNEQSGLSIDTEVPVSTIADTTAGISIDARATKEATEFLKAARRANPDVDIQIVQGYRSVAAYANDYNTRINQLVEEQDFSQEQAQQQTLTEMMQPGTNEHSLGLLINFSINGVTDPTTFEGMEASNWLKENAHNYGFIQRYPKDKDAVTGRPYDPTAYRYVGKDNARKIYEQGLTLEEYNQQLAQQQAEEAARQAEEAARQAAEQAAQQQQAQPEAAPQDNPTG